MSYNPNIPQATDLISNSQAQILTNFTQLNSIFANDHWEYNNATAANRGFHRQVTFPAVLAADPTLTGVFSEIYSKAVAGVTQLFFANSTQVTQLTGVNTIGANGAIVLQGGMIFRWGSVNFSGTATSVSPTFTAFPANIFFHCANAVTTGASAVAANVCVSQPTGLNTLVITRAGGTGVISNMTVVYFMIGN